ncbi:hypothetical protein PMAYCL1PPCAC_23616, partial [Pristionchus mayeri]
GGGDGEGRRGGRGEKEGEIEDDSHLIEWKREDTDEERSIGGHSFQAPFYLDHSDQKRRTTRERRSSSEASPITPSTPIDPPTFSIPQPTQTHQPSLSLSTSQHQDATPSPPVPPPQQPTTPRVIPSSRETGHCGIPSVVQSSLFSSPQLMFMGTDGKLQPIPSIVYVERTENGLIQLSPPTPNPHLLMSIPSTGGSGRGSRRERNLSTGKRRVSLARQILKRRRTEYAGSSEASEEDEGKRQRAKE